MCTTQFFGSSSRINKLLAACAPKHSCFEQHIFPPFLLAGVRYNDISAYPRGRRKMFKGGDHCVTLGCSYLCWLTSPLLCTCTHLVVKNTTGLYSKHTQNGIKKQHRGITLWKLVKALEALLPLIWKTWPIQGLTISSSTLAPEINLSQHLLPEHILARARGGT